MALHETGTTSCRSCGAPVQSLGPAVCLDCADETADEEEDDRPTVIAPSFGAFARQNTDESLEGRFPTPRNPTPALRNARETMDLRPSSEPALTPVAWGLLVGTVLVVVAGLLLL